MMNKSFLFCLLATLLSSCSAFVTPAKAPKTTALNWVPQGMDPAIAQMVEQTTPIASLAMGMFIVSLYEMNNGRMEKYSKSDKKGKLVQWTPDGEL